MSREIKCKAFDEDRKVFVSAKLIENESSNWIDERGFPVVWYTGLKDKKRTVIYEGDIVKAPYWNVQKIYGEVRYFGMDEVSSLFDGQYRLCLTDGRNFDMKFSEEMEVIGNIYENPELLCKT